METLNITSQHNINTRVIIYGPQKRILKTIWMTFKMYNVLYLYKHKAIIYDPIKFNKDKQRGVYYSFALNTTKSILKVMKERFWNLHQYPLRISIFEDKSFVECIYDNKTCIDIKNTYAKTTKMLINKLNVSAIFALVPNGEKYGTVFKNSTALGEFALMENQQADLTIHPHLIKDIPLKYTTYLYPMHAVNLVVYAPKGINKGQISLYEVLGFKNRLGIMCCFILVTITKQCLYYYKNKHISPLGQYILTLYGIMFLVSQKLPRNAYERLLVISFILMGMIFGYAYQGVIFKIIAASPEQELKTLEDVLQSNLDVYMGIGLVELSQAYSGPQTIRDALLKKAYFIDNAYNIAKEISQGKQAVLIINSLSSQYFHYNFISAKTGDLSTYIVQEKFLATFAGVLVLKSNPFMLRIQEIKLRITNAGFYLHMSSAKIHEWRCSTFNTTININNEKNMFFTLEKLKSLFCYYAYLNGLACLVFVLELLWYYGFFFK